MVMIYPLTIARIVGTDIFHAAALLWVAGIGHLVQGNVDLHATAWLLLGSIPGIWLSSRFTVHLPQDALRLGLAGVLALSGIKLLNVPQSSYVIAVSATLHALYAGTDTSNPAFRWAGLLALGLTGFFIFYRMLAPAESRGRNSTRAANTRRYAAHLQAQGPQPPDWL
jgi:LPXTG-motif cell wall-anchored protein